MARKRIEGLQDEKLGYPAPMYPEDLWPHIGPERARIRAALGLLALNRKYLADRDLGDEHEIPPGLHGQDSL